MLRYLNTDNGVVVEVPDWKAARYDRSCNMKRLDEPAPEPEAPAPDKPKRERKVKEQ